MCFYFLVFLPLPTSHDTYGEGPLSLEFSLEFYPEFYLEFFQELFLLPKTFMRAHTLPKSQTQTVDDLFEAFGRDLDLCSTPLGGPPLAYLSLVEFFIYATSESKENNDRVRISSLSFIVLFAALASLYYFFFVCPCLFLPTPGPGPGPALGCRKKKKNESPSLNLCIFISCSPIDLSSATPRIKYSPELSRSLKVLILIL